MLRTQLYADPTNLYLHNVILDSCRKFPQKLALLDLSCPACVQKARASKAKLRILADGVASSAVLVFVMSSIRQIQ